MNNKGFVPVPYQKHMSQYSNFTQAFQQNSPLIDKTDFTNRGNVLHNNLGDKLLNEYLAEYKIHISSADRNTLEYPNPFKMRIFFGQTDKSPAITKKFRNVKYITLDHVILPRCVSVVTTDSETDIIYPAGSTYHNDPSTAPTGKFDLLSNYRYLLVKIEELSSDNNLGTSALTGSNTFMIVADSTLGYDNVSWKVIHNNRFIFQNSGLGSISRLTISILDPDGNVLNLIDNNSRSNLIGPKIFTGDTKTYFEYLSEHESDTISHTNSSEQVILNFTFGVIENELSTSNM